MLTSCSTMTKKKALSKLMLKACKVKIWQRATLPSTKMTVPSPQRGLTSVFGMETGVTLSLWSPEKNMTELLKVHKNM
jgi:hypothetical protein